MSKDPDWQWLTERLEQRSAGRCERCGGPPGTERHHRRLRSAGGLHGLSNLVLLCNHCHHAGVHSHPLHARAHGFIVSRYAHPAAVPLLHALHGWVVLADDGTLTPVQPPPDEAA